MLPDGSQLHVVIPVVTRRPMAEDIRGLVPPAYSLNEHVPLGTLTAQAARLLEAAVAVGLDEPEATAGKNREARERGLWWTWRRCA